MEDYYKKLLLVELPSLEVRDAENDGLVIKSMCISIESLKVIQDILHEHLQEIKAYKDNYEKYIARINFFSTEDGESNVFVPTLATFKYDPVNLNETLAKQKFNEAKHYVLFQDITIKESNNKDIKLENWQHCLVQLLLQTNFSFYKNNPMHKKELSEFFTQIYKTPLNFVINPQKIGHVKLMASFLAKHFKSKEQTNIITELKLIKEAFQENIECLLIRQQNIEKVLRLTINLLANRAKGIENEVEKINRNLYQCHLARKIISKYCISYYIIDPSSKRSDLKNKKSNNSVGKYVIDFKRPARKQRFLSIKSNTDIQ